MTTALATRTTASMTIEGYGFVPFTVENLGKAFARKRASLLAEVIERSDARSEGRCSFYRSLRKDQLAAIVADWNS